MKQCTRCVMDSSDVDIIFNNSGVCSHCLNWEENLSKYYLPSNRNEQLVSMVESMKNYGKGRKYDAIIGLSGGIDSSYLAYIMVRKYNLRLLAVHVDGGWNSEVSVSNIEQLTKSLGIDLHTHVVNWGVMKRLQIAYLKSGVANQDVPQDHAFFVALYNYASKNNIKYVLNGSNLATESVLPFSWGYRAMDSRNLKSIFRKHGEGNLKGYPTVGFIKYYIFFRMIKGMKVLKPLNLIEYNKEEAKKELIDKIGYKDYGGKHHESRFTKWFQSYYLVEKFGFDKRKAHLSSMILSNTIKRQEALLQLDLPAYDQDGIDNDTKYIAKKLGITMDELNSYLVNKNGHFTEYSSNDFLYRLYFKYLKR